MLAYDLHGIVLIIRKHGEWFTPLANHGWSVESWYNKRIRMYMRVCIDTCNLSSNIPYRHTSWHIYLKLHNKHKNVGKQTMVIHYWTWYLPNLTILGNFCSFCVLISKPHTGDRYEAIWKNTEWLCKMV